MRTVFSTCVLLLIFGAASITKAQVNANDYTLPLSGLTKFRLDLGLWGGELSYDAHTVKLKVLGEVYDLDILLRRSRLGEKRPDITFATWKLLAGVPTVLVLFEDGIASINEFGSSVKETTHRINDIPNERFQQIVGDDLYATSSEHTYISRDSGASWQINEAGLSSTIYERNDIFVDAAQTVWLATNEGLYKQLLVSNTWTKVESAGNDPIRQVYVDRQQRMWVKSDSWLRVSTDGGATFQDAPTGLGFAFFARMTEDLAGNIYILTGPSSFPEGGNAVFKSIGGTERFTRIDQSIAPLFSKAGSRPYLSISGRDSLWLGTVAGGFVSTDQGASWTYAPKLNEAVIHSLVPQGSNGVVATTTGVFRRTANLEWQKTYPEQGFEAGLRIYSDKTGSRQYLVGSKLGQNSTTSPSYMIYRSTDFGATWSIDTAGGSAVGMSHLYADANGDLHAAGHIDVQGIGPVIRAWKKPWGGEWTLNMNGIPEDLDSRFALQTIGGGSATYLSFQNTSEQRSIVFRQQLSSGTWENYTSINGSVLGFSASATLHTVATPRGVGYFNAGLQMMPLPSGISVADLSYTIAAASESGRMWAWFELFDPVLGGVGTDIYYSDDQSTWIKSSSNLDSIRVGQLVASGDSLFVVTQARGVFVVHGEPSGTVNGSKQILQVRITPNPASNSIRVLLAPALSGSATVTFVDPSGTRLRSVVTTIDAGSLELDTREFSPGAYWVEIQVGDSVYSGKFIKH